jgi:hypothetical protein
MDIQSATDQLRAARDSGDLSVAMKLQRVV